MCKFKKGDTVICKIQNDYVNVNSVGVVLEDNSTCPYVQWSNKETYALNEFRMELYRSDQIHITTKGADTIAVLTDGKKEIRRSVAKCSPSDQFDFEVGAKLAFSRLMGVEEKKEESIPSIAFDWESFKQGKIAVNCDTEEKATEFLKECDTHGITWLGAQKASSMHNEATAFRCTFKNSILEYSDVEYYKECNAKIINYPFTPQVKEVKRVAKVGEWVKIVAINQGHSPLAKVGDVYRVTKAYGKGFCDVENGAGFNKEEYVVLENYTPFISTPSEPKPLDISTLSNTELIAELQRRVEK